MTAGILNPVRVQEPARASGSKPDTKRIDASADESELCGRLKKYRKKHGAALDRSTRELAAGFFGKR